MQCWFARLPGAGPCDGRLVRCHLITQQQIEKRIREMARRENKPVGLAVRAIVPGLVANRATWVPGCGGPMGNGGHHGMFKPDGSRPVPREVLPPAVEAFARELELEWWLDRTYGPREAAAA